MAPSVLVRPARNHLLTPRRAGLCAHDSVTSRGGERGLCSSLQIVHEPVQRSESFLPASHSCFPTLPVIYTSCEHLGVISKKNNQPRMECQPGRVFGAASGAEHETVTVQPPLRGESHGPAVLGALQNKKRQPRSPLQWGLYTYPQNNVSSSRTSIF